ncbi:fructose-bisphosphate aldolase, class II [Jannaschia faecimaris]|uniref:Fructose-bisphosphate aldolase, class II n=1 Tax=Jannaschia faecimaris TaxID=1244108 RepID=A0A1H3TB87_9RHOB|nr:class II fructose-bisphosphate aldolase [Jannaschia faecimaris]SDZ47506.1 fructose-bisphosphate aldolase, class II [Jannaschia faecimaris]
MTLVTLSEVLQPALRDGRAIAGVVCLGWEDARAYAHAAQAVGVSLILQAGPSCRAHTPLPVLGAMFRSLAADVDVPIVAHLDHGYEERECAAAIDAGFTSVMFDGSKLSLGDNIARTRAIAEMAHAAGVSCEGEIGFVGYADGAESRGTDPAEAAQFARDTGVDAMAISVGNVHLQTDAGSGLDEARIAAIDAMTEVPLVIHGGSGVPHAQRARLARNTSICKFNIGTELRQVFGSALRDVLAADAARFDRVQILRDVEPRIHAACVAVLRSMQD